MFIVDLLITLCMWALTYNMFTVERKVLYMRNGKIINVKGASKFTCYLAVASSVWVTWLFIHTHVIPLF